MYYVDGKPVTGNQDIDGMSFVFDQYGLTHDVPKNYRYVLYVIKKGDSFWRIAYNFGCTMSDLEQLNNKNRYQIIHHGEVFKVPVKK